MRIMIDENACVGCGLCVNSCPDCFEMGENGIAKVKSQECTGCDVKEVATQCPVNAIKIEE
ncbi:MAG: ferredoxin [Candidatus Omnitrophota bacterium]|nr:MAG: ferredoxin [Candidatus Omnitrophota bacterium]